MSIVFGTLAQEVDGKIQYVYPKTDAKIVEYDKSESVKDKLDALIDDINKINARITNIVENSEFGSGVMDNNITDELKNIRIPNYNLVSEDTTYDSAGNAVRGQFQEVLKLINNKVTAEYVDAAIENTIGIILQSDY